MLLPSVPQGLPVALPEPGKIHQQDNKNVQPEQNAWDGGLQEKTQQQVGQYESGAQYTDQQEGLIKHAGESPADAGHRCGGLRDDLQDRSYCC